MLAIIPARGGSKGLPGKNIRKINGKPLIAYTIEAAIKADCIDRVIVTTDSDEIADISKKHGAEVPFMRPNELASDNASAVDVYLHAIEYVMREKEQIDKFIVLLPTAPLRTYEHIDSAYKLFVEKNAETLISVNEAQTPVTWYMSMNNEEYIVNAGFGDTDAMLNRQENAKYYVPNGAIYILDYNILKNDRTYYSKNTVGYVMKVKESIDIDTLDDFEYAEYIMSKRQVSKAIH